MITPIGYESILWNSSFWVPSRGFKKKAIFWGFWAIIRQKNIDMYSYLSMIKYRQFKRSTSWSSVHAGPRWPWAAAETGWSLCAKQRHRPRPRPRPPRCAPGGHPASSYFQNQGTNRRLVPLFHLELLANSSRKPALGFKACLNGRTISCCETHSASSESHCNTKKWHNTLRAAVLYPSDPIIAPFQPPRLS